MSIDNILAKVNGEAVEEDQEETTTPDSPSDTEEEQEEPSQEGEESTEEVTTDNSEDDNTPSEDNVPFHKHPRWKQKQEEIELLKEQVESLKTNSTKEEPKLDAGDAPLPQWVVGLAGGDTPEARAWYKQYQQHESSLRDDIKKQALSEIKQEQEQEKKEVDKWNSWVEEETERVLDGEKDVTKNELLKAANDFQPVDAQGNISFEKALQIVKMQKTSSKTDKVETKKKIASTTTPKQGSASSNTEVNTPHSLRNRDIFDLAK